LEDREGKLESGVGWRIGKGKWVGDGLEDGEGKRERGWVDEEGKRR
jgi:hypothetical protein